MHRMSPSAIQFQPHQWLTVFSDLRQIPDTQEVFLYPNSSVSIVIEILQRVEPTHFSDAVRLGLSCNIVSVNNVQLLPDFISSHSQMTTRRNLVKSRVLKLSPMTEATTRHPQSSFPGFNSSENSTKRIQIKFVF
jgi:hypothetical protein